MGAVRDGSFLAALGTENGPRKCLGPLKQVAIPLISGDQRIFSIVIWLRRERFEEVDHARSP